MEDNTVKVNTGEHPLIRIMMIFALFIIAMLAIAYGFGFINGYVDGMKEAMKTTEKVQAELREEREEGDYVRGALATLIDRCRWSDSTGVESSCDNLQLEVGYGHLTFTPNPNGEEVVELYYVYSPDGHGRVTDFALTEGDPSVASDSYSY